MLLMVLVMALSKYKLGDLIELCEETNENLKYNLDDVKGISIQKIFIETKANMEGVSLKPYLIVKPDTFAYVTVTSRNGNKITLAHNTTENTYIVSSSYVVFKVKETNILNSNYLFMYFNRFEFDRYSRFNSWGSARETFSYEDMCSIEIELPDLATQEKYVNIYKSMIKNQEQYERGLDDLKLTCDAYIEDLRKKIATEPIGGYIEERNEKNTNLITENVLGISKDGFIPPKQDVGKLTDYLLFYKNDFVYSPPRINVGSIGLYKGEEISICSPIYVVFKVKDEEVLLADYLNIWLHRDEFLRSTDFYSIGSVRNNFSIDLMKEVKIPIPSIEVQQSIVNIYKVYHERKQINEKLKEKIKKICSILIKGSLIVNK